MIKYRTSLVFVIIRQLNRHFFGVLSVNSQSRMFEVNVIYVLREFYGRTTESIDISKYLITYALVAIINNKQFGITRQ